MFKIYIHAYIYICITYIKYEASRNSDAKAGGGGTPQALIAAEVPIRQLPWLIYGLGAYGPQT